MTEPDDDPEGEIPPAFLRTLSDEEWDRLFENNGILDEEQCARLWRMTDRQSEPPKSSQILINADDLKRLFKK